jgi:hypothetical protein
MFSVRPRGMEENHATAILLVDHEWRIRQVGVLRRASTRTTVAPVVKFIRVERDVDESFHYKHSEDMGTAWFNWRRGICRNALEVRIQRVQRIHGIFVGHREVIVHSEAEATPSKRAFKVVQSLS